MNPSLMLCLMVTPLSFAVGCALFYAQAITPAYFFVFIGFSPVAVSIWQLVKFTNNDVSRLQDGEHNENMFRLSQGIGVREGDTFTERPIAGELVGNPAIEDRRGE